MNEKTRSVLLSKTTLGALFFVVFLDNLGSAIVVHYLFFYVLALGGSAFLYGVLLASYSLMSFVFIPFLARLSDRYRRRKILLAELAISSLSYFIFGSAQLFGCYLQVKCFLEPQMLPSLLLKLMLWTSLPQIKDYVTSGSGRGVVSAEISVVNCTFGFKF